jgi:hypothetical protein
MLVHFKDHPRIMEAFINLLEDVEARNSKLRGTANYKLIESEYNCSLMYDVEVSDGACFGVDISDEMLALVLLKYAKASSALT